jgi:hypothetical protein
MSPKRLVVPLGIAALLALAGVAYALSRNLSSPNLSVDEAYFVERGRDGGGNLTVESVLFMSNRGGGSAGDIRVSAFVVPTRTGLAIDTVTTSVSAIRKAHTSEVRLPIHVPKLNASAPESYNVVFLVFEDGLLTLKGTGTVGYATCCFYNTAYDVDSVAAPAGKAATLQSSAPSFTRVG